MKRHLVKTPQGQLHFLSAGSLDTDRAVLFFHQSPSSSWMWSKVMADLAERGLSSVAGDLFNYGGSDRQPDLLDLHHHADLLLGAARSLSSASLTAVGHHTGAVFAASCAARHTLDGLVLMGYPLYGSRKEKQDRLGAKMHQDSFAPDGSELAALWVRLNRSLEDETAFSDRHAILVDRLSAGPLWFTAYAALLATDLEGTLREALDTGTPIKTVFAAQDALSRLAPGITALTGLTPIWIGGGPWVSVEHPRRVADVVHSAFREWA
ncbi:MAG: alpha/beta hydrolase [bacterium]|nr:alpha/beta hydrolase [Acidimicrobiia bacterium]MCY4651317.1 alpha/beta hydrolase [bacterium]